MNYPALVKYPSPSDYEHHFRKKYCQSSIKTFDGIEVSFLPTQFQHAFYTSPRGSKSKTIFDTERAERIDWIAIALQDRKAQLRQGYDNQKKIPRPERRVCMVKKNYVVVIQIRSANKAVFITAFLADKSAKKKILLNPPWK